MRVLDDSWVWSSVEPQIKGHANYYQNSTEFARIDPEFVRPKLDGHEPYDRKPGKGEICKCKCWGNSTKSAVESKFAPSPPMRDKQHLIGGLKSQHLEFGTSVRGSSIDRRNILSLTQSLQYLQYCCSVRDVHCAVLESSCWSILFGGISFLNCWDDVPRSWTIQFPSIQNRSGKGNNLTRRVVPDQNRQCFCSVIICIA